MHIGEVRELNDRQLAEELSNQERALMNLHFRKATLQMTDVHEIRRVRRTIARIKTAVREREIVAAQSGAEQGD